MWLNLVFFIAFCGEAISESPGLRTMYMISVFIGVYMLCCTWNILGWFPTGAGSRSLPPMIKVALLICSPPAAVGTSMRAKASIKLVCVIGCHCIIMRECIGSHTVMSQLTATRNVSVTYVTSVP